MSPTNLLGRRTAALAAVALALHLLMLVAHQVSATPVGHGAGVDTAGALATVDEEAPDEPAGHGASDHDPGAHALMGCLAILAAAAAIALLRIHHSAPCPLERPRTNLALVTASPPTRAPPTRTPVTDHVVLLA